ncbi:23S rRNA (guanosine-2'-O-) -methyltransferase rlmB [Minicystis rosea]|nr:23S rRNA (guanosine-2'-O-) -methyltransferase rlmB [Minicystis rosea]
MHGDRIERVFIERSGGPKLDALARFAEGRGIPVEFVGRGDLDRRSTGGRHQGVIAVAPDLVLAHLDRVPTGPGSITVALDGVMDPQNFGAVIRSAVALGATAILWPEHASAPLSPATFRASAGAVEHALLCRVPSLPGALEELAARGVTAIALDAQGPTELGAVDLRGPVAIVIGAEDKGTRRGVRKACRYTARLPMAGPIASLNASVAGAIALHEVVRQRRPVAVAEPTSPAGDGDG